MILFTAKFLTDEQRDVLTSVPPLTPTMESIVQGRAAYARLFLPRARRLMQTNNMTYPQAFEDATWRYLNERLGLDVT